MKLEEMIKDGADYGSSLNVYRTRDFIVVQNIDFSSDIEGNPILLSHDTYFYRTPSRDKSYEEAFDYRSNVDGRRITSTSYIRQYADYHN